MLRINLIEREDNQSEESSEREPDNMVSSVHTEEPTVLIKRENHYSTFLSNDWF